MSNRKSNRTKPLLLDTHALVQYVRKDPIIDSLEEQLDNVRRAGHLFVSSVSFWEIGLLVQKNRLAIDDISRWTDQVLNASSIQLLSPSVMNMISSTTLPPHHRDPFDRLLTAQAIAHDMPLVTCDTNIRKYRVKVFWNE